MLAVAGVNLRRIDAMSIKVRTQVLASRTILYNKSENPVISKIVISRDTCPLAIHEHFIKTAGVERVSLNNLLQVRQVAEADRSRDVVHVILVAYFFDILLTAERLALGTVQAVPAEEPRSLRQAFGYGSESAAWIYIESSAVAAGQVLDGLERIADEITAGLDEGAMGGVLDDWDAATGELAELFIVTAPTGPVDTDNSSTSAPRMRSVVAERRGLFNVDAASERVDLSPNDVGAAADYGRVSSCAGDRRRDDIVAGADAAEMESQIDSVGARRYSQGARRESESLLKEVLELVYSLPLADVPALECPGDPLQSLRRHEHFEEGYSWELQRRFAFAESCNHLTYLPTFLLLSTPPRGQAAAQPRGTSRRC